MTGSRIRLLFGSLRQPLTFLAVGLGATSIYTLLSTLCVSCAGWPPVAAGFVSYILLVPPTYLAQKKLTFEVRASGERRFFRYAALQTFGLMTSTAANSGFAVSTGQFHGIFFFVSALAAAGLNYLIMRAWVFADTAAMAAQPADRG